MAIGLGAVLGSTLAEGLLALLGGHGGEAAVHLVDYLVEVARKQPADCSPIEREVQELELVLIRRIRKVADGPGVWAWLRANLPTRTAKDLRAAIKGKLPG